MYGNGLANRSILLLLALALSGCAVPRASFRTTPVQPMEPADSFPYYAIHVNVESATAEPAFEEVRTITEGLVRRLQEMNVTSQVIHTYETDVDEGQLLIHLSVTDIRRVGGWQRFFLGIFAGKASVTAKVDLFCGDTQSLIGSYEIFAESTTRSETRDAIRATIDGVADILTENYRLAPG